MSNVHILPDENLGGVLREYVEVDRKAKVGDKKILPDGTILTAVKPYDRGDGKTPGMWFQDTHGERYPYYNNDNNRLVEPTDIIHIDDQRYRMVDREAKVGEKVIVVKAYINGESYKNGDIFIVHEVQHSVIFVTVDSGRYIAISHFEYNVLDPVESAEENDDVLTVDEAEASKSVIDLLANLARRVTELERKLGEYTRKIDGIEVDIQNINVDLGTVEENVEMILDDIVTLDERTQPLLALIKAVKEESE